MLSEAGARVKASKRPAVAKNERPKENENDMKKIRTLLSVVLWLFVVLMARHAFAAPAPSADFVLDVPAEFTASSITAVGDGLYCVSGDVFHDEVPSYSAMVALVDSRTRRTRWKTNIPYAKDHYQNSAGKCIRDGEFYYVLTEERTDSFEAQSHTQLIVSKISSTGKLLKSQRVDVARDVWSNLFEAGPEGLSIVGGASTDSVGRGGRRSLFWDRLDRDLSRKQLVVLPTGAFWTGTYAKLDGASLVISGAFLANAGTGASAREGYAVSKVDLSRERYVWSTFVYPLKMEAQRAVSVADGSIAYVGVNEDHLLVSVIDASGRVARSMSAQKAVCSVDALGVKAAALQVVGTRCGKPQSTLLLDMDPTTGAIASSRDIGEGTTAALIDGDAIWMVLAKPDSDRKIFRRVPR